MVKNSDEIRKVVKNVVDALKARRVRVDKVILYGSYACGEPGPDSDIDLAVISRSFEKKGLLKRQELLGEVVFWLKEPVEMIGYSYSEYERNPKATLLSVILSKGRVVYEE
jgi:predicted nucleotidyltransferase